MFRACGRTRGRDATKKKGLTKKRMERGKERTKGGSRHVSPVKGGNGTRSRCARRCNAVTATDRRRSFSRRQLGLRAFPFSTISPLYPYRSVRAVARIIARAAAPKDRGVRSRVRICFRGCFGVLLFWSPACQDGVRCYTTLKRRRSARPLGVSFFSPVVVIFA